MTALSFTTLPPTVSPATGEVWIRGCKILHPLGISERTLHYILAKHNFTDRDTIVIPEETNGGTQKVRHFSKQGALKVAFFSNTKMKDTAVEALIKAATEPPKRQTTTAIRDRVPPTREVIQVLDEVKRLLLANELTQAKINALMEGLPLEDPLLRELVSEREKLTEAKRHVDAALRENDLKAVRAGYESGAVRRHMRQLRRFRQQPSLPFNAGEA